MSQCTVEFVDGYHRRRCSRDAKEGFAVCSPHLAGINGKRARQERKQAQQDRERREREDIDTLAQRLQNAGVDVFVTYAATGDHRVTLTIAAAEKLLALLPPGDEGGA